jgi:hypothetical protein
LSSVALFGTTLLATALLAGSALMPSASNKGSLDSLSVTRLYVDSFWPPQCVPPTVKCSQVCAACSHSLDGSMSLITTNKTCSFNICH